MGRLVGRPWMSPAAEAGEVLYAEDLPGCCQRGAHATVRHDADRFECPVCGALWQAPALVEPEACAFTERMDDRERKGAA